jgi:hypothetical protein
MRLFTRGVCNTLQSLKQSVGFEYHVLLQSRVAVRSTVKGNVYTVLSESLCALRLRYVDLVVSIEVAVEVCCCFTVFSC